MANFKSGDIVVFKLTPPYIVPLAHIYPAHEELVTISHPSKSFNGSYVLKEYPLNRKGGHQSFKKQHLYPLNKILSEQTQVMVNKITKEINEEQLTEV